MQLSSSDEALRTDTLKYAFFDGDNVGNTIENLLNRNRVAEATHLSESIKLSIFQIELFVRSIEHVEIVIAGGDDLLIRYDSEKCQFELLERISNLFTIQTGLSMSYGVGDDISQAINNLAKVKRRNKEATKIASDLLTASDRSMKQAELYIFVTSDIPDPYINVIVHCETYYQNLHQIKLVGIVEDRRKIRLKKDELEQLKQNIENQLDSLSRGRYLKKKGRQWEELEIGIDAVDCQTYSRLKGFPIDCQVLSYLNLEEEIKKILRAEDSVLHIFDVTAALKSYLVDIYSILRFRNISTVYSFELFNDRSYDDKDLIHNQTFGKTYDFTCLAESSYTKDKIVVNEDSIISENDFNRMQFDFRILQSDYEELEDVLATDFAKLCSFTYFLFLIPVFGWVCWSITQPDGWNQVEPLAFVVTFGWVLLNYLLQSLFTGKFPAFDPRELFSASKRWRKQELQRSRLKTKRSSNMYAGKWK